MEEYDLRTLLDLSAYIKQAGEAGHMTMEAILLHVEHDVDGLLKGRQWIAQNYWVPRTNGWNTFVEEKLIG